MNFLQKKRSVEPVVKPAGKIVIIDFDRLDPKDYPYSDLTKENTKERFLLLSFDGKYYLNRDMEGAEVIANILDVLVRQSRYDLDQWRKSKKKKYAELTFDNIDEIQDKQELPYAFAYLLVPTEIKRRQIERQYYCEK